jgi:hypothetical protein
MKRILVFSRKSIYEIQERKDERELPQKHWTNKTLFDLTRTYLTTALLPNETDDRDDTKGRREPKLNG